MKWIFIFAIIVRVFCFDENSANDYSRQMTEYLQGRKFVAIAQSSCKVNRDGGDKIMTTVIIITDGLI